MRQFWRITCIGAYKVNIKMAALIVAIFVGGCSLTPPKPPSCDGSDRRPVNAPVQAAVVDSCSRG